LTWCFFGTLKGAVRFPSFYQSWSFVGAVVTGALYLFSCSGIQSTKSHPKEEGAMQTVADNHMDLTGKRVVTGVVMRSRAEAGDWIAACGARLIQYGLVLVVGWIGLMKFTAYEATGIQPLVAHSPVLSWAYQLLSVQAFSDVLGATEIAIALMIALRPLSATVAAIGSGLAVMMFLTTLSFLFSTPGWEPSLGGFPALSVVPGQFILKDVILLGVAVWLLGDTLKDLA
jgi:reactive chlorine resistance protein C